MQISLLFALSSSIGYALGADYCVESQPGFDAKFYSYPLDGESTLLAGPFYFLGGYKTKGDVIATTHGVTDIRAHQDVDSGFFPTSEDGTVYGQDVSVTNFGVVLTGYFYAEQSGVYKFTLPADHSGIGIQFGAGMSSDIFNLATDAVAHSTEQIAEEGDDSSDVVQDVIDDFKNGLQNVNNGNKAGSSDSSIHSLKNALGSVKSAFTNAFTIGPSWYSTTTSVTYSLPMIAGQYYPVRVVYFHPSGTMDISLPWTMPDGTQRNDFNNVYQWQIESDKCHGPPQKTTSLNTISSSTQATPTDETSTEGSSTSPSPSSVPSVSHSLPVDFTSGVVPIPTAVSSSVVHSNSAPGSSSIGQSSQFPSAQRSSTSNAAYTNSVVSKSGALSHQSSSASAGTATSPKVRSPSSEASGSSLNPAMSNSVATSGAKSSNIGPTSQSSNTVATGGNNKAASSTGGVSSSATNTYSTGLSSNSGNSFTSSSAASSGNAFPTKSTIPSELTSSSHADTASSKASPSEFSSSGLTFPTKSSNGAQSTVISSTKKW